MKNNNALTLKCISDVARTQSAMVGVLGGRTGDESHLKQLVAPTEEAEIQVELLVRKVEKLRANIANT
jgi:hypothetical protein